MTPQDILENVGAEVSDMREVMNRGTASVHAHRGAISRREGVGCTCERIGQLEHRA